VSDLSGRASIEITAPIETCFALAADGGTLATYALDIRLNRVLGLLRKGVRGPAEAAVRSLLTERPLEGLKREAEAAAVTVAGVAGSVRSRR
jgi:hypothetical protein